MNRKNPLNPTIGDLILEESRLVSWMKLEYPKRVDAGDLHPAVSQMRIACHETLLRLLKKAKKDPQTNLLQEIQKAYTEPKVEKVAGFNVITDSRMPPDTFAVGYPDHTHVELPSGAIANVDSGATPELLNALDHMCELAKRRFDNDPDLYSTPEGY